MVVFATEPICSPIARCSWHKARHLIVHWRWSNYASPRKDPLKNIAGPNIGSLAGIEPRQSMLDKSRNGFEPTGDGIVN
jgi:hypothetical protein